MKRIAATGNAFYWMVKLVCGTLFLLFGYDAGVLGGLLAYPPFLNAIGNPTDAWTIPMIASSYTLAACVVSPFVSTFAFYSGRRGCMILGCLLVIVGAVVQAASYSVGQMIAGRVIVGFGIGSISSSVPAYLAETGMHADSRGPAGALNGSLLIGGVPLAYWIDYGFTKKEGDARWRIPIALQGVFAIAALVMLLFFPDTPRWYYARGREQDGDTALAQLTGCDSSAPLFRQTKQEIFAAIEMELAANKSLKWTEFLTFGLLDKSPEKIVRRLSMCFWLTFCRQWAGINLIVYYLPLILIAAGLSPSLVSVLAGVVTTWFFLGTIPLFFTVERIGRRKLLLAGTSIETILMMIFIILISLEKPTTGTIWGTFVVICAFVFVFGWCTAGLVWLTVPELAPLRYRHIGSSLASTGEWLATFLTTFAGPIGITSVGYKLYFWILTGNVAFTLFVYFLVPDVTGLTLEQIDAVYASGQSASHKVDPEKLHLYSLDPYEKEKGMDARVVPV